MDVLRVGTIICNVVAFGADQNAMSSLGLEIESPFWIRSTKEGQM